MEFKLHVEGSIFRRFKWEVCHMAELLLLCIVSGTRCFLNPNDLACLIISDQLLIVILDVRLEIDIVSSLSAPVLIRNELCF